MRARKLVLLFASAGFLLGSVVSAAAQTSPPMGATNVSASDPASDDWRERAMQAREVPDDAPNGDWRERAMLARAEVPDEAPNGRLRDPEGLADLAEAGMPDAAELAADRTDGRKSSE